ncbi:MAG: SpoIIE family protein phosphatase [Bacteroidota bacterium]|nr:SpoIIE family protein phosphatase [Bacteroidota bacterium]
MFRILNISLKFLFLSIPAEAFLQQTSSKVNSIPLSQDQLETEIHRQDFYIGLVIFLIFLLISLWALGKKNRQLRKMATFAENDPNPVLELDLDFKLKYCNEAAMKYENLVELMYERHPLRKKFEYLLNMTIKDKKTGKYIFDQPFVLDDTYFSLNLYVNKEMKFLRAYMSDITEKTLLQRKITQQRDSIVDSLNYAKYIQRSLLPDIKKMENYFGDNFVFSIPKDIVGGDFYWFKTFEEKAILIAADCTGHGVPGGFITMLGSLLIESSTGDTLKSPEIILRDLNYGLVTLLKQQEKDSIQDGMDLAICLIDRKQKTLNFSGSRNGIYIIHDDGEISNYSGDTVPVGGVYSKKHNPLEREYKMHEIQLKDDDWVFMYSDGFYDQFGGPKNKSMGSNRFKNYLKEAVMSKKTSYNDFEYFFSEWKGSQEQIDDVLVIGFKL